MSSQRVIALDIGATKVACVIAHGLREVLGSSVVAYPSVSASWPGDAPVIGRTIEQAVDAAGGAGGKSRVIVAISHPHITHAQVTASVDLSAEPVPVQSRDVARLRQQALGQALGMDQEALWLEPLGYQGNGFEQVRDPRTLPTTRLRGTFALVAMPLVVRQVVVRAVEIAGLDVDCLIYGPQALAVACNDPETSGRGTEPWLLIDLGGCSTECLIVHQGRLQRGLTLAWGGLTVVEAIASRCRTTWNQALAWSLSGLSSPKDEVRAIWQEQLDAFKSSLQPLLDGASLPARAIVSGRGALVDGIVEWVQSALEMSATLGRHARNPSAELSEQVALSTAFGALELVEHPAPMTARPPSSRFVDRLVDRTRSLLVEYF